MKNADRKRVQAPPIMKTFVFLLLALGNVFYLAVIKEEHMCLHDLISDFKEKLIVYRHMLFFITAQFQLKLKLI